MKAVWQVIDQKWDLFPPNRVGMFAQQERKREGMKGHFPHGEPEPHHILVVCLIVLSLMNRSLNDVSINFTKAYSLALHNLEVSCRPQKVISLSSLNWMHLLHLLEAEWPPGWPSGQHAWLLIMRSRVRSPVLPQILNVDWVWNGVHPASWGQLGSYLIEK